MNDRNLTLKKISQKNAFEWVVYTFFLLQFTFSMFGERLLRTQNIYPFYTWKIFHPQPDKYLINSFVYIYALDDTTFPEPKDVFDIQSLFPSVNMYTLSKKINVAGDDFGQPRSNKAIEEIKEALKSDHKSIVWELRRVKFEVIDYYISHKTESEMVLTKIYDEPI